MANTHPIWLKRISLLSLLLAMGVILLGAYTRLTDAGLGCPDWPGCYGQFTAPHTDQTIAQANLAFPTLPVEVRKAHTEMTHRYFAETLGSLIILLAIFAYRQRKYHPLPSWMGPLLVALVLAQGLLGMWTVTLRLLPLVVMGHLLGGFCTLSLLWISWLYLNYSTIPSFKIPPKLLALSLATLGVVVIQIALGGWTSANYAALICPDFPKCQGQWWPRLDFMQALNLLGAIDATHPLAFMTTPGKTAIHVMHRIGALFTLILGSTLIFSLWQAAKHALPPQIKRSLQFFSLGLLVLLLLQISLGISNVLFFLPLPIAVAHNGIAACLLLTLIALIFVLFQGSKHPHG